MYAKNVSKNPNESLVTVRLAHSEKDIDVIFKMFKLWVKDYNKAGDFGQALSAKEIKSNVLKNNFVVLIYLGKYAGFSQLKRCGNVTIKVIYITPRFRKIGLSGILYRHLIESYDATEIELTYTRALRNLEYWKAIGFNSLRSRFANCYNKGELCYVSIEPKTNFKFAAELNRRDIAAYRNRFE